MSLCPMDISSFIAAILTSIHKCSKTHKGMMWKVGIAVMAEQYNFYKYKCFLKYFVIGSPQYAIESVSDILQLVNIY